MKQNILKSWANPSQFLQSRQKKVELVSKSIINYFKEDREKLVITITFLLFPIILNSYQITPEFYVPYYESFHSFLFTLSESFCHLILAIAVYFAYNKKDTFMQLLPLGSIMFIFYQIAAKLFSVVTPGWIELIFLSFSIGVFVYFLTVVKNKAIADKNHKIHHGLRQPLCRIKGLAGITMQDKDLQIALMGNEVNKLDELLREYSELFKMEEVE